MVLLLGGLTNIADVLGAGGVMRDRGRYRNRAQFVWLPSGSTAFTGHVIGYAPFASGITSTVDDVSGLVGVDGGTAYPVYGWGAVEVDRWASSSVQVTGGIAWGVSYPAGGNIPSYAGMAAALDRTNKDGTYAAIDYRVQHAAAGGTLVATTNVVNQSGAGVLKALSCMIDYVPPGTTTDASLALDVSVDGTYRFSVGITRRTLTGDNQTPGMTASVGYIPYSSNLTVALRRSHNGTQMQVYASVLHYLGA